MIPFGTETVTLYRRNRIVENGRTVENWSRRVLTGCSWRRTSRIRMADGAALSVIEVVCRIPPGKIVPAPGDVLVRGICRLQVGSAREASELALSQPDSFRIASVSDNTAEPLAHIAARGELTC